MSTVPRVPEPEGPHAEFYRRCAGGVLHLQRCADCGRFQHPPRHRCPGCSGIALVWEPSPGSGVLFSWTVTHRQVDPGWADLPYTTGVVELQEGVRLVGSLEVPRDDLEIGLPLVVVLRPMAPDFVFLALVRL